MRSFTQLLNESKKTYQFKIGVAGPLPEGFEDRMETSLKKFKVSKFFLEKNRFKNCNYELRKT